MVLNSVQKQVVKREGQKYLLRGERTKLGKIPKEKRDLLLLLFIPSAR